MPAPRAAAIGLLALACACGGPGVPGTQSPPGSDGGDGGAGPDGGSAAGSFDGGPLCAADPPPAPLGDAVLTAGATDRFLLKGRLVTPDAVIDPGEVLVAAGKIACVGACAARAQAAGATVIDTKGVIFPGLVDAHNHTQYDYLPIWPNPLPAGQYFQNRYVWAARPDYSAWTASVNANEATFLCEQVKYGEIRALLGGTTTMQGTFGTDRKCFQTLVRNAEYSSAAGGFPNTDVRTNVPGIDSVTDAYAATLRTGMGNGSITAYVIHLAEGVDASSKAEFTKLVSKGLLLAPTVLIHATALGAAEFAQVAAAHAKVIWSPQSNLLLYGATTDVPAALAAGVHVSLAPDWTLSGGPTQLQEIKSARSLSCDKWKGLLDAKALVQMVTSEPADALGLQSAVGRLAPGLFADLLVIRDRGLDPYRTLVEAQMADVRLVMIAGNLRYGDAALLAAAGRTPCESLKMCGEEKWLCVPDAASPNPDKLDQGFVQILGAIRGFYANPLPVDACP